jgi:hypothetical protein
MARAAIPSSVSYSFDSGSFDEEDCRYFLHNVGKQIVPTLPFSCGMEEVYKAIVARYGYAAIPDATSLLAELLETETSAAGLGDDSDIWRPWFYSWKHRNVSLAIDSRRNRLTPPGQSSQSFHPSNWHFLPSESDPATNSEDPCTQLHSTECSGSATKRDQGSCCQS